MFEEVLTSGNHLALQPTIPASSDNYRNCPNFDKCPSREKGCKNCLYPENIQAFKLRPPPCQRNPWITLDT